MPGLLPRISQLLWCLANLPYPPFPPSSSLSTCFPWQGRECNPGSPHPCQPSHCAVQVLLSIRVSSAERKRQKGAPWILSRASSPGISPPFPCSLYCWVFGSPPTMTLKSFLTVLLMPHMGPLGKQKPPKISAKYKSSLPCLQQPGWQLPALCPAEVSSSWPEQLSLGIVAAAGVGSGEWGLSKSQFLMDCHGKEMKMLGLALLTCLCTLSCPPWQEWASSGAGETS